MKQRTLEKTIEVTGVGLHSGERVKMTMNPAPCDHGIVFKRTDLEGDQSRNIKLIPSLINDTRLSSTIVTEDGIRIGTIEHLMSSLAAMGVDNVLIELNAPEVPIMDGSSLPFVYLLKDAGIVDQEAEKKLIKIVEKVEVDEGDKKVTLEPSDGFMVDLRIEFNHPLFNDENQHFKIDFGKASYIDEIARARTFGFMQEIELMRSHNLGLGGNLNNAVVIDDIDVLNPEGLRYPDEFVRHKILDAIGDLYVIGHQIIGKFTGVKSGHAINNKLIRKVLENPGSYKLVTSKDDASIDYFFHQVEPEKV